MQAILRHKSQIRIGKFMMNTLHWLFGFLI